MSQNGDGKLHEVFLTGTLMATVCVCPYLYMCACVYIFVRACVRACVRVCACMRVRVCVRG